MLEQAGREGVRPYKRLEFGAKTYVMGILNLTPVSFFGDGLLQSSDPLQAALEQAQRDKKALIAAIAAGSEWSLALVPVSVPAPRIFNAAYQNGKFSFLMQTFCRNRYTVESTTSLNSPAWSATSTNAGNGALLYIQQTPAPTPPRLYRVRQSPR